MSEGPYQAQTRQPFAEYTEAWIDRYQGTGRRGFAEHTRGDYRRDLKAYPFPRLGGLRLEQITPRHISEFVAWLAARGVSEVSAAPTPLDTTAVSQTEPVAAGTLASVVATTPRTSPA